MDKSNICASGDLKECLKKKTTETPAGWIGSDRELPEKQAGFRVGRLVIEKTLELDFWHDESSDAFLRQ